MPRLASPAIKLKLGSSPEVQIQARTQAMIDDMLESSKKILEAFALIFKN